MKTSVAHMQAVPTIGYLRLPQIIGDKEKGIPPIIPVSKSTWWAGVKSGRYPQPIRTLGYRITAWSVDDIHALVRSLGSRNVND